MSFTVTPNCLLGHTVVLTGKVLSIGRSEMHSKIRSAGGQPADKVDRSTTVLVAEGGAGGPATTKRKEATKRGIPIISGQLFRRVLTGQVSIQDAMRSGQSAASAPVAPQAAAPTPVVKKVSKRDQRQRDAAVRQIEKLAAKQADGPYAIDF